jgi:predicted site-specific integrase-resolvase
MGVAIANRTGRIYISNRKLFVQITSAPLKSELAMSKSKIVEILNREAREDVLEDVIFI